MLRNFIFKIIFIQFIQKKAHAEENIDKKAHINAFSQVKVSGIVLRNLLIPYSLTFKSEHKLVKKSFQSHIIKFYLNNEQIFAPYIIILNYAILWGVYLV